MTAAYVLDEPALGTPARFDGAMIRLYGGDVLVVLVRPEVLADHYESSRLVLAFHDQFRHTIVLAARDARGIPRYWGPGAIVRVLSAIPFDALCWRRYRRRPPLPPPMLPVPEDLPSELTDSRPSWSWCETPDTACERPSNEGSLKATRVLRK